MKKRTQEKVAKIFALVVILIMLFQVLMPLFSSVNSSSQSTAANVTASAEPAATGSETAPVADATAGIVQVSGDGKLVPVTTSAPAVTTDTVSATPVDTSADNQ